MVQKRLVSVVPMALLALVLAMATIVSGCAQPAPALPAAPAPAAAPAPKVLKFNAFSTSTGAAADSVNAYLDRIEQGTNGKLKFERYWMGQLIPAGEEMDAVGKGVAQAAWAVFTNHTKTLPLSDVANLPGIPKDAKTNATALYELYKMKEIQDDFVKWNVVPVAVQGGLGKVLVSKKPVRTLNDLKGMKIRASGADAKVLESFGATSVGVASTEMFEAMQRGTVDAVAISITGARIWKLEELMKYATEFPLSFSSMVYVINKDTYNGLSDDVKAVIKKAGDEEPQSQYDFMYGKGDAVTVKEWKDKGIELISLSKADFDKAAPAGKPLWDAWAADKDKAGLAGTKVLNQFMKLNGW